MLGKIGRGLVIVGVDDATGDVNEVGCFPLGVYEAGEITALSTKAWNEKGDVWDMG